LKTNWNDTQTAYNLWARLVDRPAEWWFSGSITIWTTYKLMGVGNYTEFEIMSPYEACVRGDADQVLRHVQYCQSQMEIVL